MNARKIGRIVAAVGAATLVLASCGSDDTTSSDTSTSTGDTSESLSVSDAWARSTPEDAERTAIYLTVESHEDDTIIGASVPGDIAAEAELHEPATEGMDEGMDDEHGGGAITMRAVDQIPVAKGTTTLEPGGYHLMLMGLVEPLIDGETFDLTLDLEHGSPLSVTVTVRSG